MHILVCIRMRVYDTEYLNGVSQTTMENSWFTTSKFKELPGRCFEFMCQQELSGIEIPKPTQTTLSEKSLR